ncbi:MAG: leucine-rich repeat domain-containing protein, partial [Clostridia bacterium]|nr:leucine-rich repeat domain-containing protein [Clostridia bacterium]
MILAMTSLLVSLFAPFVSAAEDSGTCGGNLSWTLSEAGVLTISGTGDMKNYSELYTAPWYSHKAEIRMIVVEEGVTSIGNRAFRDLEHVLSVKLPTTLKTIGKYAFVNCLKLKTLSFSSGLETIREGAFDNCEALMSVRLPETLKTLERKAFYGCSSLKCIDVPASVTSFGDLVFSNCTSLVTANIKASVETLPVWTFYGCELLTAVYLADNISSIGAGAFENCKNFYIVNYGGSEEQGVNILPSLDGQNDKEASDYTIYYDENPFYQGESTDSYSEQDVIVTNKNNVITTENATISTTVTTKTEYTTGSEGIIWGDSEVNVTIDAVVENEKGWDELFSAIQNGENQNVDRNQIDVDITLKDSAEVTNDTLNQFVGRDELNLNISSGRFFRADRLRSIGISGGREDFFEIHS